MGTEQEIPRAYLRITIGKPKKKVFLPWLTLLKKHDPLIREAAKKSLF